MENALKVAKQAALEAGRHLKQAQMNLSDRHTQLKKRNDLVTEFDWSSEQIIVDMIQTHFPTHRFMTEESGDIEGSEDYCWIIDPIDGTTNFARGVPHFAISIAMKYQDHMEVGVIYDPMRDEMFYAQRNRGAFLNGQAIQVSGHPHIQSALLGTGFPCKEATWVAPYMRCFEAIFPKSLGMRRAGAAALDLAYVACGRLDGFWEFDLNLWDIAAAQVIIAEAGGILVDCHGGQDAPALGVIAGDTQLCTELKTIIAPQWSPKR